MSSPRFEPWLMPETIRSGSDSTRPSAAKRTQSTGVPSVANPVVPSSNSISSTQSGSRVVMLRAVALLFESGAITASSTSGTPRSALRMAFRPVAWMPSSLVRRTFIGAQLRIVAGAAGPPPPPGSITHRLEVEAVGRGGVAGVRPRGAFQQPGELLYRHPARAHGEHRAHQRADHVTHEGVRLDPVLQAIWAVRKPLRAQDDALEAHVIALRGREGGEVMRAGDRLSACVQSIQVEGPRPVQGKAALEHRGRLPREQPVPVKATAG